MPFHTWLAFIAVTTAVSYTPGPNMLLSLSHGIQHGPRRCLATAAGLISALWVLMALSVAGFGAVMAASGPAFQMVKWCGVVYLGWLGIKLWRAAPATLTVPDDSAVTSPGLWRIACQAFGVSLSNPKAIIFFSALFPQFVDSALPLLPQVLTMALSFSVIEFSMIMSAALSGGRLAPWLNKSGRGRWINRFSGSVLLAAAVMLAGVRRA